MTDTPPSAPPPAAGARRRGPVDPVLALMHRHYDLCARAVDPLEIAAGLEAHGITDRVAARFRHRDVFTLAEELYARVPRDHAGPAGGRPLDRGAAGGAMTRRATLWHLLPALACAAGVAAAHLLPPAAAPWTGAGTLALVLLTMPAAVRHGPLRAARARGAALAACWLLGFALYGPQATAWLLHAAGEPSAHRAAGLPGLLDPAAAAGFLARALALPPAAWCARGFAGRARARLADSPGLAAFRAAVRPLLTRALGLFTAVLLALLACAYLVLAGGTGGGGGPFHVPVADLVGLGGALALGLLLLTAHLLAVHGCPAAGALGLGTACAAECLALAAAALPPAAGVLGAFVRLAGPGAVQAAVCGPAALVLAGYALRALGRASAHAARDAEGPPPYDPAYAAALFGSPHAYAAATAR